METLIAESKEQFRSLVADLLATGYSVSVDTETEPFDGVKLPWELRVEGIGLYTPSLHAFAPLASIDLEALQELVNWKQLIMQNSKFDLHVLSGLGVDVSKADVFDTMVMGWLYDENESVGLKDMAKRLLKRKDVVKYDDLGECPKPGTLFAEDDRKKIEEWKVKLAEYCLDDCKNTFDLFVLLKGKLEEEDLWATYMVVEKPMAGIIRRMERTGVMIDSEYLLGVGNKLDVKIAEIGEDISKMVGGELNPGSTKQLREYFFAKKKYVLPEDFRTPKGDMSTDKEALNWLADEKGDQMAKRILEWREMTKIKSTYVDGIVEKLRDGVLHASFNQTGTATGRWSSSSPNCQNIIRQEGDFDIRHAFMARPGYVFVISDFSQIELRVLAYFSGCQRMIETYKNNGDIHKATAEAVGCDRVTAKQINFGINYGRSAYGMARAMRMKETDAQKFIDEYFRNFPQILTFMKSCAGLIKKYGYIQSICGKKRRFPKYARALEKDDWKEIKAMNRQASNSAIQSSAADILKLAIKKLDPLIENIGGRILLQIHDEVVVEVPKEKEEEATRIVTDSMQSVMKLGEVPLIANTKTSDRWVK